MSTDSNGVKAHKGDRVAFASRVGNSAKLKHGRVVQALANGVDILTDGGRDTFRQDRDYAIVKGQVPGEKIDE